MSDEGQLPGRKDKTLFTPGPLTTSRSVKLALLRDLGSRDREFIEIVRSIRSGLLELGGAGGDYEAVLMQGSGTFALEAVVSSTIPPSGKMLVIVNGAYGKRVAKMATVAKIDCEALTFAEDSLPDLDQIRSRLRAEEALTHVAVVHCETTTGIVNPIRKSARWSTSSGASISSMQ